jgi:hypothetical protein
MNVEHDAQEWMDNTVRNIALQLAAEAKEEAKRKSSASILLKHATKAKRILDRENMPSRWSQAGLIFGSGILSISGGEFASLLHDQLTTKGVDNTNGLIACGVAFALSAVLLVVSIIFT